MEKQNKDIDILNRETENLKLDHKKALKDLNISYKENLKRVIEKAQLEKKEAVLEIRTEYHGKLEETQAKANERI